MKWDENPKKSTSKGHNLDAELKLLRFFAENSTTSVPEEHVRDYGDNLVNIEALVNNELLMIEDVNTHDKGTIRYYRITPKGYRFVKEEDESKRNIWILIITCATLAVSVMTLLYTMKVV